jgi:hypothetical protein
MEIPIIMPFEDARRMTPFTEEDDGFEDWVDVDDN